MTSAQYTLAYGELSLPRPWVVSPFVRLGAGIASIRRNDETLREVRDVAPVGYAEAGVGLEVWYLYVRLGGFALSARDGVAGVSLALGAFF